MSPRSRRRRPLRTAFLFLAGVSMLTVSAGLLRGHALAVLEVRQVSLPLVAEVPRLERRLATLQDQVEMAELHAATRVGSQEERINVYVLPEDIDFDRLLAVFEILTQALENDGLLTGFSDLSMSDPVSAGDGLMIRSLTMKFSAHEDGVQTFLSLVKLAGLLSVGDTLSSDERRLLLQKTEEENPAGVVAIEQFLSTDLLTYAREPKTYEAQLMRSFSSPSFTKALQDTIQSSLLKDARRILGGTVGSELLRYDLWPLPLMVLEDARIQSGGAPGWFALGVQLRVYSRNGEE